MKNFLKNLEIKSIKDNIHYIPIFLFTFLFFLVSSSLILQYLYSINTLKNIGEEVRIAHESFFNVINNGENIFMETFGSVPDKFIKDTAEKNEILELKMKILQNYNNFKQRIDVHEKEGKELEKTVSEEIAKNLFLNKFLFSIVFLFLLFLIFYINHYINHYIKDLKYALLVKLDEID